mmetsp:Transcript_109942/g.298158  ORF Transcript_109942/g.298158 Transcript_109942/m.298158 type:complete len:203 (-) Transcript_109942:916-1524(-)
MPSTACRWSSVSAGGSSTSTFTYRSPKVAGSSRCGIPSPRILSIWNGLVTLSVPTSTVCPSRCLMVCWNPSRASRSETLMATCKSSPRRSNLLCLAVFSVKTTPPGMMPGRCSAILSNFTVSPFRIPFSICTSRGVLSSLHFSLLWTSSCCCMNIPGPTCRFTIRTSLGHRWHPLHFGESGLVRHPRHTTRRRMEALCTPLE